MSIQEKETEMESTAEGLETLTDDKLLELLKYWSIEIGHVEEMILMFPTDRMRREERLFSEEDLLAEAFTILQIPRIIKRRTFLAQLLTTDDATRLRAIQLLCPHCSSVRKCCSFHRDGK